jgi:hypothetical protein
MSRRSIRPGAIRAGRLTSFVLLVLHYAKTGEPKADKAPAATGGGVAASELLRFASRPATHSCRCPHRRGGRRSVARPTVDGGGLGATRRDPLPQGWTAPALPSPEHRNVAARPALLTDNFAPKWYPRVVPMPAPDPLQPCNLAQNVAVCRIFLRADEGIRTLDLRHGKATL